jgi:CMP-N-acetylneuraminic acid synthetase
MNDNKYLVIIPARGGSKRLPRKNILELNQKPLIVWSIEAAFKSKYVNEVIVTSDDDEILNIAQNYGSKIIKRPAYLANDTASSFDAIVHTIDDTQDYENVILLQPTSPLRTEKHIDEAIQLFESKNADAIISVCEMDHSPLWSNVINKDLSLKGFLNEDILNKRSQDLKKYFRINGAIYICKIEKLLEEKTFFINDNIYAYIMDRESSIDIDEKIDFKIAEIIMKENNV